MTMIKDDVGYIVFNSIYFLLNFLGYLSPVASDNMTTSSKYFDQLNIAAGQRVTLTCPNKDPGPENLPGPFDWWYVESNVNRSVCSGKTVLATNGRLVKGSRTNNDRLRFNSNGKNLTIMNVHVNDTGHYVCVHSCGFEGSRRINMDVKPYIQAAVGSNVTIQCFSTTHDVDWVYQSATDTKSYNIYSNQILYDGYRDSGRFALPQTNHRENFSLVITDVRWNDSGLYTCHEDSGAGDKHTVRLITSYSVQAGKNVTLPCYTTLKDDVVWNYWRAFPSRHRNVYAGGVVDTSFVDRFAVVKDDVGHRNMTIRNVQTKDSGVYACVEGQGMHDYHHMELFVKENKIPTDSTQSDIIDVTTRQQPLTESLYSGATTTKMGAEIESVALQPCSESTYRIALICCAIFAFVLLPANILVILYLIGCSSVLLSTRIKYSELPKTQDTNLTSELELLEMGPNPAEIVPEPLLVNEIIEKVLFKSTILLILKEVPAGGIPMCEILTVIPATCHYFRFIFTTHTIVKLKRVKPSVGRFPLLNVLSVGSTKSPVTGVAELDSRIYVTTANSSAIKVFEGVPTKWKLSDEITVSGLHEPSDIVACSLVNGSMSCVCVVDEASESLRVVNLHTKSAIKTREVSVESPLTLSTVDDKLIVCSPRNKTNAITVFKLSVKAGILQPERTLSFSIRTDPAYKPSHCSALHALCLSSDLTQYLVGWKNASGIRCDLNEILIYREGRTKPVTNCQHRLHRLSLAKLRQPVAAAHLAMDIIRRRLFIADSSNNCLLMVDFSGDEQGACQRILAKFDGSFPVSRLCFVQEVKHLLVAGGDCVRIYDSSYLDDAQNCY